jgi:hypothetical protein
LCQGLWLACKTYGRPLGYHPQVETEHYRADGSPYNGMMRAGGMGGRVVPSEGNHGADGQCGYISWHRDKPPADMWPLPNYRLIKVCHYITVII